MEPKCWRISCNKHSTLSGIVLERKKDKIESFPIDQFKGPAYSASERQCKTFCARHSANSVFFRCVVIDNQDRIPAGSAVNLNSSLNDPSLFECVTAVKFWLGRALNSLPE